MGTIHYLSQSTSRKKQTTKNSLLTDSPDSLEEWMERYIQLAVEGVRSNEVMKKIALHLSRFLHFFEESYGHDRISTCLKRDVVAWQSFLEDSGFHPATVNNHVSSLSAFTTWVYAQNEMLFSVGDPCKGIKELGLPPLEPRTLNDAQVRSLKNLCDRLERFHRLKGRKWNAGNQLPPIKANSRPYRDRAIVFTLLSTGMRREELVNVDLKQLSETNPETLRQARKVKIHGVKGKGKTEKNVFLSADARQALADYIEIERPRDASNQTQALFLSATGLSARKPDGRLSKRSINNILGQIGKWHDAEIKDPERHISPLQPHDLRHTFAFRLSEETGGDSYELERRLGHRSQRYIQRYTNPPEEIAATYVETF